jgi:hypothetical protein
VFYDTRYSLTNAKLRKCALSFNEPIGEPLKEHEVVYYKAHMAPSGVKPDVPLLITKVLAPPMVTTARPDNMSFNIPVNVVIRTIDTDGDFVSLPAHEWQLTRQKPQ